MLKVIILWAIVPIAIFLSLTVFNNVLLTFILFYGIICLLIPIVDLIIIKKKSFIEYFLSLGFINFKKSFVPSVITGIIFCLSIVLFFIFLDKYVLDIEQMKHILDDWNINNKYIIPLLFTMIIANSVFEEVYWRGYIYKKLEVLVSIRMTLILTSLFYASYHLITTVNLFSFLYGLIFTTIIFGIGMFWGLMRKRYDSIYFPIISHLLADLGIMIIYVKYLL